VQPVTEGLDLLAGHRADGRRLADLHEVAAQAFSDLGELGRGPAEQLGALLQQAADTARTEALGQHGRREGRRQAELVVPAEVVGHEHSRRHLAFVLHGHSSPASCAPAGHPVFRFGTRPDLRLYAQDRDKETHELTYPAKFTRDLFECDHALRTGPLDRRPRSPAI
jgi:hypothetical protein